MNEASISDITRTAGRKSLFHFTRMRNLPSIACLDELRSSSLIRDQASAIGSQASGSGLSGERRLKPMEVKAGPHTMTINAHLRIPDAMLAPGVTQERFRACLDRHVFFWPTVRDCRKMIETYERREPGERFAVLEFDAYALLSAHASAVKLSKYDSGSAPRFPHNCSYRKSPEMFLPLHRFRLDVNRTVPVKPSEIREVLIEERVRRVTDCLRSVYADSGEEVPERWRRLANPLAQLRGDGS